MYIYYNLIPSSMIVSTPAINSLVHNMVSQRCTNDPLTSHQARHYSTIFFEKKVSCFKNIIVRVKSRKLSNKKIKKSASIRHKYVQKKISI